MTKSPLEENKMKQITTSAYNDYEDADRYVVPGNDPNRAYKWIDFAQFQTSGYSDHRGWQPLTASNITTEKVVDPSKEYGVKGDGFFHNGNNILAWMPMELYEKKREVLDHRNNTRLKSIDDRMKSMMQGEEGTFGNMKIKDRTGTVTHKFGTEFKV